MSQNKLEDIALLSLFVGVTLLLFFVFVPFVSVLALAAVFAVMLHRPYEWLVRTCGKCRGIMAALIVLLLIIFFIVPIFFLGNQILHEAQNVYVNMYGSGAHYLAIVRNSLEGAVQRIFPGFVFDVNGFVGNALTTISSRLGALAYQAVTVFFETFLMLFAVFFFLRDGRNLPTTIARIVPIQKTVVHEILSRLYKTTHAIVAGTFVTALLRWACMSIAFYALGIPNALLWGSIGGIIGVIPGLGTPFAFIPAVAYLAIQGNAAAAIGLAIVGILISIFIDNLLTAYFFRRGFVGAASVPSPIFVLFSILGGIVLFGPIGFILGPLVLSLFLSVAHGYATMRAKHEQAS